MDSNSQMRNGRIAVIVITIFCISAAVYAYIQLSEAKNTMNSLIESKEEQVRLKESLKNCEEKNAMLEYRSVHLQQSLKNQTKMTEELLKRSK